MPRHIMQTVVLTLAIALFNGKTVAEGSQCWIVVLDGIEETPVAGAEISHTTSGERWMTDAHGRAAVSLENGDQLSIQHPGYVDHRDLILDASASLVVHLAPLPETGLVSLVFRDDRGQPVTPDFVYLGNREQALEIEVSEPLSELMVRMPANRYAVAVSGQYVDGFGITRKEHGLGEVTLPGESERHGHDAEEAGDTEYFVVVRPQQVVDVEVTFPRLSTLRGFVSGLVGREASVRVVPNLGGDLHCGFVAHLARKVGVDADGLFETWVAAGSYSVALVGAPETEARFVRVEPGQVIELSLVGGD